MKKYKDILVIVDLNQPQHKALTRAADIARKFDSRITLVSCIYESFIDLIPSSIQIDHEQIQQESISNLRQELQELIEENALKDSDIEVEIIWHKSFHTGLTEFINNNQFDLVMKSISQHNALLDFFFTPSDWHLLRDTSVDIFFVRHTSYDTKNNVLGAINIESDDEHRVLNEKIVKQTALFADYFQGSSSIINVFPWPMIKFEKFNHLFDKKDLFQEIKNQHCKEVKDFVGQYKNITGKIIIAEGLETESTIPELLKTTRSSLLVLGTVGRKGLDAAIIGNTAEKILSEIDCDVLAVK